MVHTRFSFHDSGNYVTGCDGQITLFEYDPNTDKEDEVTVGEMCVEIYRFSEEINDGYRPPSTLEGWVAKAHSVEGEEVFHFLTSGKEYPYIPKKVDRFLGDPSGGSIHFLREIKLDKEHRGKGYGLKATYDYVKLVAGIDGASIVVCQASPMREESDKPDGVKRLQNHWGKIGFRHVPKSEYCVIQPSQLKTPKVITSLG